MRFFRRNLQVYILLLFVLIGIIKGGVASQKLHCIQCPSVRSRGSCKGEEQGSPIQCLKGEVCVKETVVYEFRQKDGKKQTEERTKRNCVHFNPDTDIGRLGECVWVEDVSYPFPGYRCLCDDESFCNRTNSVNAKGHWLLLLLLLFPLFVHLVFKYFLS